MFEFLIVNAVASKIGMNILSTFLPDLLVPGTGSLSWLMPLLYQWGMTSIIKNIIYSIGNLLTSNDEIVTKIEYSTDDKEIKELNKKLEENNRNLEKEMENLRQELIKELADKENVELEKMQVFIDEYVAPIKENLISSLNSYEKLDKFLKTLEEDDLKVFRNINVFEKNIKDTNVVRLLMSKGFYPRFKDVLKKPKLFGVENKLKTVESYQDKLQSFVDGVDYQKMVEDFIQLDSERICNNNISEEDVLLRNKLEEFLFEIKDFTKIDIDNLHDVNCKTFKKKDELNKYNIEDLDNKLNYFRDEMKKFREMLLKNIK